jgi:hypothetical protein
MLSGISIYKRNPVLLFISILLFCFSSVRASYDFNTACRKAYAEIFNLNFKTAEEIIAREKSSNPNNTVTILLENNIDFLSAFISEEDLYYKKLMAEKKERLNRAEESDAKSPFCLCAQADIHLQSALVKLKFAEYISASTELLKANSLLKKNQNLFPSFLLNLKGLGMLHAMAGLIPSDFRWAADLAGFDGTLTQGINELDSLFKHMDASEYGFLKPEVAMLLFYLKTNFEQQDSDSFFTGYFSDTTLLHNPLVAFSYSGFLMKRSKTDDAIKILESVSTGDFPFLMLEYRLGHAKLCRGDKDAIDHLLKFAASFKGKNYIRSAFRFVAWYYLLNDDEKKYKQFIANVLYTGNSYTDEDKDAARESEKRQMPNKKLLRARLLYDGGFYKTALAELENPANVTLRNQRDSAEYDYRLARIYHAQKDTTRAENSYINAFNKGKVLPQHYAANAALQLGNIYEQRGNKPKAKEWYQKCLWLPPHDYKNSIEQKAKAGLERVQD